MSNETMKNLEELFKNYTVTTTPHFSLNGQKMWGRVVSLYDGDTLTIALNVFNSIYRFTVRLNGIDTCEIKSKNENNKELAKNARNRMLSLITGKDVTETSTWNDRRKINNVLNKDVYLVWIECFDFDKYGRLLANLYSDENSVECFSKLLIKEKLGYEYKGNTKLTEEEQINCLSA